MHRQAGVMHVDAWLSAHACCWLACCHVTMTCLPAHERVLQAESLHACRAMLLTCVMLPWTGQLRTCCGRQASASCPSACCMQLVQPRPLRIRLPATPAHRWSPACAHFFAAPPACTLTWCALSAIATGSLQSSACTGHHSAIGNSMTIAPFASTPSWSFPAWLQT